MKTQKTPKFVFNAIMLSLLSMPVMAAYDVNIEQKPLYGVSKVTPALVVAPSVEYPTAGAAIKNQSLSLNDIKVGQPLFLGYFNPKKCYKYIVTIEHGQPGGYAAGGGSNKEFRDAVAGGTSETLSEFGDGVNVNFGDGYFAISSDAVSAGGYQGLCTGEKEWSGNVMNFMTMSALDIFRSTLTGGNRAKGVGSSRDVYLAGDTPEKAYLRRANQWTKATTHPNETKDQQDAAMMRRSFAKSVYTARINGNPALHYLIPNNYYDTMREISKSDGVLGSDVAYTAGKKYKITWNSGGKTATYECAAQPLKSIVFMNNGTGFNIRFLYGKMATAIYASDGETFSAGNNGVPGGTPLSCPIPNTAFTEAGNDATAKWFNVVVEQEGHPTGLIQDYAQRGMRTAVMSYLVGTDGDEGHVADAYKVDGGVLRANMRNVAGDSTLGESAEWNSDGTLKFDPDGLGTPMGSGVINYINKFGDAQPYDALDRLATLYYTAVRYLRNGKWDGDTRVGPAGSLPYPIPADAQDDARASEGFPVITTWDDPLNPSGDPNKLKDGVCFAPAIITIGDTNTWGDADLPHMRTYGKSNNDDDVAKESDGSNSYDKVYEIQGSNWLGGDKGASLGGASGATKDPATSTVLGMPGIAYWVKTHNIRPDISAADKASGGVGNQLHINTFAIDVLEDSRYHNWVASAGGYTGRNTMYNWGESLTVGNASEVANPYYLAGKFGGFNHVDGQDPVMELRNRASWTDDPASTMINNSSIEAYSDGKPRNFALANDPTSMKNALVSAFTSLGGEDNLMQTGLQYNNASTVRLQLKDSKELKGAELNCTTVGGSETCKFASDADKERVYELASTGKIPLTFRSIYKTSNWTGTLLASIMMDAGKDASSGASLGFKEVILWNGGNNLFASYHTNMGDTTSRFVESMNDSGTIERLLPSSYSNFAGSITGAAFDLDQINYYNRLPSTVTAQDLVKYILGDKTLEADGTLRSRKESLMGTSIYSTAVPILHDGAGRTHDFVSNSSNEGMLHIFNMRGEEVYAYLPQSALPYIANYASPSYNHHFVNDGTSIITKDGKYLVGTSGRGASSVYGIDISTEGAFHAVFEVNSKTNPNIGVNIGKPVDLGSNSIAFSSGYNAKGSSGSIFIYNFATERLTEVSLGSFGVGTPFGYDSDLDGVIDRIYVGDHNGSVYRVDGNCAGGGAACSWSSPSKKTIFTGTGLPVNSRPYVAKVKGKTVVLFGTGETFNEDQLRDAGQNYAYGIFEEDVLSGAASGKILLEQEIKTNYVSSKDLTGEHELKYYEGTANELDEKIHKGWRLKLPYGYVVTSDAGIYGPNDEIVTYTINKTSEDRSNSCSIVGSSAFVMVDSESGGAWKGKPLFDINNDGQFTQEDQIAGGLSPTMVETDINGQETTIAYVMGEDGNPVNIANMSDGDSNAQFAVNDLGAGGKQYRRISWRLLTQ